MANEHNSNPVRKDVLKDFYEKFKSCTSFENFSKPESRDTFLVTAGELKGRCSDGEIYVLLGSPIYLCDGKRSILHNAVALNCVTIVEELATKHPGTLSVRDNDDKMPLHTALETKNFKLAEHIFNAMKKHDPELTRCVLNTPDKTGKTPIDYAKDNAHLTAIFDELNCVGRRIAGSRLRANSAPQSLGGEVYGPMRHVERERAHSAPNSPALH